ncbi:MAG TPA: GGDEF domain-containing protein [Solirubrobacterales bacterium]|nr:GGDEF domain-containing protein [Solirubrobacterales bacterium]
MQTIPEQIQQARAAFAEAPDERGRMGRISGVLWMFSAVVGVIDVSLPGSQHAAMPLVLVLATAIFLYGFASVVGWIPWERASINALAIGMVLTIPVAGLAIYMTGGSLSYIEPLLVCPLLYAAFFFPERWAWPLTVELIIVAGAPLVYDAGAIDNAFLPRYIALAVGFLAGTWVMTGLKKRLVAAEVRQREFANRDPLTGVGNRRYFDATMKRELERRTLPFGRRGLDTSPLALLILDLDDFKGINDRHGHQVGDAVLQEATARALAVLRSTDTLARIGGDEFAVIAPGAHGEGAARLADAVRVAVAAGDPENELPTPTTSVGWAVFPDDGQDFETLMRSADDRMLRIKRSDPRREESLPF